MTEEQASQAPSRTPESPDQIRKDLIRRLFAVAIGVGVGFALSRMSWVADANNHWPKFAEWQQLAILAAAMTATVLSWDGYLISIEQRPLFGFFRFGIDVALVFIYMLLIMTSHHKTWWLSIHTLTYLIYMSWDLITVSEQTAKFYPTNFSGTKSTAMVYWRGLRDITPRESAGPIITVNWALYFVALWFTNRDGLEDRIFATVFFVLAGLIAYRVDKIYRWKMIVRFVVAAALVLADNLYVCAGKFNDLWFQQFLPTYSG